MAYYTCVVFAALIATVFANVATKYNCEGANADICSIGEVRIDPCKYKRECEFKKGINATLEFDFLPNFNANKLKTAVYWDKGNADIQFQDLQEDRACELTKCPTESGTSQHLTYILHIGKLMPKGRYMLKWKVWNADDDQQMCCFKINIKISKKKL